MAEASSIAVALVHHPIINRMGESSTTAITSIDVHDFARTCAMFDIGPVYLVHPSEGMHALVKDIAGHWIEGEGGSRNPGRKEVMKGIRLAFSLEEILQDETFQLWYTSAIPPEDKAVCVEKLPKMAGKHLIVFGTGSGLDYANMPKPNGWLSPIEGIGMVRHLSVRAALAIYLDRLSR